METSSSLPGRDIFFYVSANGSVETLLETHADKVNTADIGYDPEKRILYVPTFNARKIVMYRVL